MSGRTAMTRAGSFAASVGARHAELGLHRVRSRDNTARPVARTYLRRPRPWLAVGGPRISVQANPHFALTVVRPNVRPATQANLFGPSISSPAAVLRSRVERVPLGPREIPQSALRPRRQLVERILARRRVEATPSGGPRAVLHPRAESGGSGPEHVRPVPRVVIRRAALDPPTSAAPPSEVWSPPDRPDLWETGRAPNLTSPMVVQPDVGRLTDQVIRAIDDRLIAWRERMGR